MCVPDEVLCVCCTLIYSVYYSIASTSLSTMHASNVKLMVENDSCKVALIPSYSEEEMMYVKVSLVQTRNPSGTLA